MLRSASAAVVAIACLRAARVHADPVTKPAAIPGPGEASSSSGPLQADLDTDLVVALPAVSLGLSSKLTLNGSRLFVGLQVGARGQWVTAVVANLWSASGSVTLFSGFRD